MCRLIGAVSLCSWPGVAITPPRRRPVVRPTTLTIGFGLASGESRMPAFRRPFATSPSKGWSPSPAMAGRTPWLAEQLVGVADGLIDSPADCADATVPRRHAGHRPVVRDILAAATARVSRTGLRATSQSIRAVADHELEFVLKQRSTFVLEASMLRLPRPDAVADRHRAFRPTGRLDADEVEMRRQRALLRGQARRRSHRAQAAIRRSAPRGPTCCAGSVDMLYEVGVDALDSLRPRPASRSSRFATLRVYGRC